MTNEEKARELCMAIEPPYIDFIQQNYKTALQAMKWKDEQHKQEKQQWIDKACEWIKDNATYYAYWEWNGDTYEKEVVFDAEECDEAFKKAMKGE